MSSVERTVLHPQAANSIGRISSFLFIMHLAFESVRGRRRDNACASRADSSGRAIATAAATAAEADESAHDQESGNSDSSPDQDIRHSAPRFSFVVRNPLASQPLGRTRLSSRRRTLCTIPVSLSVVVTTELQIFSFRCASTLPLDGHLRPLLDLDASRDAGEGSHDIRIFAVLTASSA